MTVAETKVAPANTKAVADQLDEKLRIANAIVRKGSSLLHVKDVITKLEEEEIATWAEFQSGCTDPAHKGDPYFEGYSNGVARAIELLTGGE